MKKKLLSATLVLTLAASSFGALAYAEAAAKDTEIAFKVGDSSLSINGVSTNVETPYVVGEGVTLVPLRVITEAFGAEVKWEGETKTITLNYPDITIVLQIGNVMAKVNGVEQKLLSAPELTPNGVTMVPLRFISETFGAEVGYKAEDGSILVSKKAPVVKDTYIGDDFYGWMMKTPTGFEKISQSFDCGEIVYQSGMSSLSITIEPSSDDQTVDDMLKELTEDVAEFTIVKAESDLKDSKCKRINVQAKSSTSFVDIRSYVADKYTYTLKAVTDTSVAGMKDKTSLIMDSFKLEYKGEEITNLSTVKDGYREFNSEELGLRMKLSKDFYFVDISSKNLLLFADENDDTNRMISVDVYSKKAGETAKTVAEASRAETIKNSNAKIKKISNIEEKTYGDNKVYQYSSDTVGSYKNDRYISYFFIEKGDYIYTMHISASTTIESKENFYNSILSEVKISDAGAVKLGKLEEEKYDSEVEKEEITGTGWKVNVPITFYKIETESGDLAVVNPFKQTYVQLFTQEAVATGAAIKNYVAEMTRKIGTVVEDVKQVKIGSYTYYTGVAYEKDEKNGEAYYIKLYVLSYRGKLYTFDTGIHELSYYESNIKEVEDIIASFVVN